MTATDKTLPESMLVDEACKSSRTALQKAAEEGHTAVVQQLLQEGAAIDEHSADDD
jgi:hypothetical protein